LPRSPRMAPCGAVVCQRCDTLPRVSLKNSNKTSLSSKVNLNHIEPRRGWNSGLSIVAFYGNNSRGLRSQRLETHLCIFWHRRSRWKSHFIRLSYAPSAGFARKRSCRPTRANSSTNARTVGECFDQNPAIAVSIVRTVPFVVQANRKTAGTAIRLLPHANLSLDVTEIPILE
jgi:hypothetical protein